MKNHKIPSIRFKGFNDAWEQRKLCDLVAYQSSPLTAKDATDNGKYILYDANQVIGTTNKLNIEQDYITIIKDGAGVGRIRILPKNTAFIGTMGAIIPNRNDLDFVFALLTNSDLNKKFSGSTIPHIYFKDYGKEFYLVPVLSEQYLVGRLFKQIDYLITLHQRDCFFKAPKETSSLNQHLYFLVPELYEDMFFQSYSYLNDLIFLRRLQLTHQRTKVKMRVYV